MFQVLPSSGLTQPIKAAGVRIMAKKTPPLTHPGEAALGSAAASLVPGRRGTALVAVRNAVAVGVAVVAVRNAVAVGVAVRRVPVSVAAVRRLVVRIAVVHTAGQKSCKAGDGEDSFDVAHDVLLHCRKTVAGKSTMHFE